MLEPMVVVVVSPHHVIPQADSHLSVSSLAQVEAVHREEARVGFAHLVEKAAVLKRRRWFGRVPSCCTLATHSDLRDEVVL